MPAKRSGAAGKTPRSPPNKAVSSRAKPCPICGKPSVEASTPFCSERCRDVDLNRWLSGSYAIPGKPTDDEDAD
jgi:endogenous inhibitor of DNA gyrase (YacG/DUF329 family)